MNFFVQRAKYSCLVPGLRWQPEAMILCQQAQEKSYTGIIRHPGVAELVRYLEYDLVFQCAD